MKKHNKVILLVSGILLLFVLNLQLVIPVFYFGCGFIMYVILFCWAKAKGVDAQHDVWDPILNSTKGMFYFILSGSVIWAPVLISFVITQRQKRKLEKERKNERLPMWVEYFKNPTKLHRDWFDRFYQ
ncbi:hypothetical protein [Paenibacillus illinoisensis]|uniref:hypothetical protein n=1 Tax=Paenibacillus illinoisensis TaxID=59845 RepID=UPI001C8E76DA|nr:hypothetical protein [Paenibacillus illinoisensis]MBY0217913.1 hypothetical protein [Paenibacillus illinoisensis]